MAKPKKSAPSKPARKPKAKRRRAESTPDANQTAKRVVDRVVALTGDKGNTPPENE